VKPSQPRAGGVSRPVLLQEVVGGILALLLVTPAVAAQSTPTPAAAAAQGDVTGLVDIGGRRLYMECQGTGSPTVVLGAGGYARGDYWTRDLHEPAGRRQMVLPTVAGFTRVCTYDRPGTVSDPDPGADPGGPDFLPSRSDPVPMPRTAREIVPELHALLQTAGVPGPYVLVGHSISGPFVRMYASAYPDEVVGMVLVDATPEDVWQRFQAALTPTQWEPFERLQFSMEPQDQYPDYELLDQQAIVAQMREVQAATPLRPMPLAVLAHGVPFDPPTPDWPTEVTEQIMLETERNLATLVPNARFSVASQAGHNIHQEQPALVIEAIRQVVMGVRDRDTWYDLAACCAP
jgi:pimeloyl-ACP methyl ester carboxylesterase